MKKIILSFLVAIVAATGTTYAQSYASDAYRFSQTNYGSTSRFKGMGGAQIGVGGDIGSIGANPAGLGLFTKSEFSLTPEFNSVTNKSNFLTKSTEASKNQLNLSNIGVVFYSPTYKAKGSDVNKGLVSSVFGIGYNRNNDFFNNIGYQGINNSSSIRDAYVEQANSFGANGTLGGNAFSQGLINYNTPTFPKQYSAEPYSHSNFDQNYNETRYGSTSEFNIAGGLNFSNSFYIGASVSFVDVKYRSEKTYTENGNLNMYTETVPAPANPYDNYDNNVAYSLNQVTHQDTKGSGINLKLGMIFRPVSELKIGLNFVSPTWLTMHDNTNANVNGKLKGYNGAANNNPINDGFEYNLKTPLKASAGISYIIASRAIIAADVDYVDYSSMRFSLASGQSSLNAIQYNNNFIKANYKATANYRFGAEVKVSDELSLRGGYALNGSGIKDGDNNFFATKIISGGLGYRVDNYYIDATYQNTKTNFYSSPYELDDLSEPLATIKNQRNNVFLTFGVRF